MTTAPSYLLDARLPGGLFCFAAPASGTRNATLAALRYLAAAAAASDFRAPPAPAPPSATHHSANPRALPLRDPTAPPRRSAPVARALPARATPAPASCPG